jgi:hypothetical protein
MAVLSPVRIRVPSQIDGTAKAETKTLGGDEIV